MTLGEIMTPDPKALAPNTNVQRAAEMMRDQNVGSIPIVDDVGSLVGIVTDRDIAVKVVADGRGSDTKVEQVMTRQPASAPPDLPLQEAIHLMSLHQIRRLPVTAYGKLIGMVTLSDIAASQATNDEKAEALVGVSQAAIESRYAEIRSISQY